MTTMFDEKNVSFGHSCCYCPFPLWFGQCRLHGNFGSFCQVPAFAEETTNMVINVLFCYFNLFINRLS